MRQPTIPLRKLIPVIPVLAFFLWTSFYGLNFGVHWDETRSKFDSVKNSIDSGLLMQGIPDPDRKDNTYYTYGGVNYLLTWAGLTPEVFKFLHAEKWNRQALSNAISPAIYTVSTRVRVRGIYVVLCSLSIVWLYCLNIVLGRSRMEAFLAAAILAGSWEFAYHSRWIAPDVLMMQFVLLSFFALAMGRETKKTGWFYIAAVAVGLAAGTKYPAGLSIFFIVPGALQVLWQKQRSVTTLLKHSIGLGGTAFATFVLTTPGVLLDPFSFFGHLEYLRIAYMSGHYGYTVVPGISHFTKILQYYLLQLFSHYPPVSVVITVFCVVGIVALLMERRLFNYLFLGLAFAYIGYFSQQTELVVRNVLIAVPVLCMAVARGITVLSQSVGPRWRIALATLVGIALSVNFGWETYAATQIKKRNNSAYFMRQFVNYATSHSADTVFISTKLANALHTLPIPIPPNLVTDPDRHYTLAAFFQTEGPDTFWETWPCDWWGMYVRSFGALEVNLDAYPTFIGNQRILLTTTKHFQRLPIKAKDMLTP